MKSKIIIVMMMFFLGIDNVQSQDKNSFSIQLGIGGGDGFGLVAVRTMNYNRQILNRTYIKLGYSLASQTIRMSDAFARPEIRSEFLESKFVNTENESNDPIVGYSQFNSFNLGLQYAIRQTDGASISIYGGLRYFKFDEMSFFSFGSDIDRFLKESIDHKESLAYDIGLYYNQKITDVIGVNGSIDYFSGLGFFSGNIGLDVYF